ncbi:MAG TPA: LUD domain-containing protein [Ktedonobacterales bacterium]|nr:LUD domain-containing protein [Ktedonobacterales bacterium]
MTTLVPNMDFARVASDEDITTVVAALTANGMAASVVENRAEARSRVLDLLPEGAEVYTALSQTLEALGLREEISASSRYVPLRPQIEQLGREGRTSRAGRKLLASPEYVIGSVHAITHQGQALIASGGGSQLAGYAYGASHAIWVVGTQKIVRNVDEGLRRIWEYSYPLENQRMQSLYGMDSFPAKILLVQKELPGRISVLLVKEALGF